MIKKYLSSFIHLFYPKLCGACGNSLASTELSLCTNCLIDFPYTNYWNHKENPVEQLFWGRAKVEFATSFIFFEKGSKYQNALHQLKYNGREDIGLILGRFFGNKLLDSRFNKVDAIVPVPLHKSRLRKRGFNQSEIIASGIASKLNKPLITNAVIRTKPNKSQTNKARYERWLNVCDIFECTNPSALKNKHLLVVDDIITTGATLESFINTIIDIEDVKISVATIACA